MGKALVLGGHGRFGSHVAEAFWNAGWEVSLYQRGTDLMAAARGADVIVNGWNPPYHLWAAELPGLTDRVIAAARVSGATVLQAGNLYVYGAGSPECLSVDTPHRARNPLGRLRIRTEAQLRAAGVKVILLRAGDFLDTEPSGNWFDRILAPKLAKGVLTYPGAPEIPHAWAFLPDVGRAALALAERRGDLPSFTEVLFPGSPLSGRDIAAHLETITGHDVALRGFSWWPLHLARPVWPMAGDLLEMRYLWNMPHRLDPAPFRALLPEFRTTPAEEALRAATAHLMDPPASRAPSGAAAPARAA
ncbi:epimerase [Salipiger sp. P9]|uniref:epimerase n=1 Tax=Salipiger pentaromativorans TaxID=2943193 RepID=UPI002157DE79|nr:epimerase [Salipiger pentaromativorans]MCR8548273.1 epimerase [Salipiger pentaromativorans]